VFWTGLAAVLFIIVWLTALAPGYVMSNFYGKLQLKLAGIAGEESGQGSGSVSDQQERGVAQSQKTADVSTTLLQRVAAVKGETGLHFAGVPMTLQKAITVGTLIVYLAQYFPKGTISPFGGHDYSIGHVPFRGT
jgi:hypothetical protein